MFRDKGFGGVLAVLIFLTSLLIMVPQAIAQVDITNVGSWRMGPGGGFACRASIVYIASGSTIQTWDVTDAANPVLASETPYPWPINKLEFRGDWLVGVSDYGLLTMDLSDPMDPLDIAIIDFPFAHSDRLFCMGGDYAYLMDDYGELMVYDLTDPSTPVQVYYDSTPTNDCESLAYENGTLYASTLSDGTFMVLDVSDPDNIGEADLYMCMEMINPDGIFVLDGVIHLFTGTSGWVIGEIDGDELVVVSTLSVTSTRAHHYFENTLVTFVDGDIQVYQFPTTPDSPVLSQTLSLDLSSNIQTLRYSGDVIVFQTYDDDFSVLDLSTEATSDFLFPDRVSAGGLYEDIYVSVDSRSPRMSFFDLSDPANIPAPTTLDLPGEALYLTINDGYALASDLQDGVFVVDLTAGAPYSVRDVVEIEGYHRVTGYHDGYLYLSQSNPYLLNIYDLFIPGTPQEVASFATSSSAKDMVFYNDYLLFLTWNSLISFDISDPENTTLISTLQVPGHSFDQLTMSQGIIYVATGDENDGMDLVDIDANGELTYRGNFAASGRISGLRSMSNRLYGYAGNFGTSVFDATDPENIQTIINLPTFTSVFDLDIWGSKFVTIEYHSGFTVYIDGDVTPVHLGTFDAIRIPDGAQVAWRVFAEFDDSAFHVWRGNSTWDRVRQTSAPLSGDVSFAWVDPAPPTTATNYWLEETHTGGISDWYGPVELKAMDLPRSAALHEPWPNPFNPLVALRVELPRAAHLVVTIHDVRGRHVATLADERHDAGEFVLNWDGRNDQGQSMSTGAYFARLKTADQTSVQKLMLVR